MITYATSTDPAELREAYRLLMAPSFRAAELLPESDFIAQFADGADAVLARDDDGRLLGLAVVEDFRHAVLLQYLVAAAESRGMGVGSGLLTTVIDGWASTVSVVLAEFVRPDVQSAHPLYGDPAARLRFYARFGALALDLPYFQPPVSADTGREHGMLLAVFDVDGSIAARGRLSSAQRSAVQNYLNEVLDNAQDPDATRLRDAAGADRGIRALPLDDYAKIARSPL